MSTFQLGRLPATRPFGLSDLSVYTKGKLPDPPASVSVPNAPYPLDGNGTYGDCTIAGVAHLISAWNAEVHEADEVPSDQEVTSTYFQMTGGADTGLNEANVLQTWHTDGLFGEKIAGYAPIQPRDFVGIHQSIAFYGGVYFGIACPASAQQQFQAGETWTYVPGSPVEGGHCIVGLGYLPDGSILCATWGGIATVSLGFLAHFLEEAWAVIPHQFVEHGGDGHGLDIPALQADLAAL